MEFFDVVNILLVMYWNCYRMILLAVIVIIGACRMYNFVPVNTTASVIGGVMSDGLLRLFRSVVDLLYNNVLINNVNLIDLSSIMLKMYLVMELK